jgi:transposase
MGRTLKLTEEVQDKICVAIRLGNDKKVAAALAGVSETTFYRWLEMAELPNAKKEYREFRESIERAEAEAEVTRIARITQAADNGTWQAASWWLERKFPERWGRNDKIRQEITGNINGAVAITFDEVKNAVLEFLSEGDDGSINSGTDTEETESGETPLA